MTSIINLLNPADGPPRCPPAHTRAPAAYMNTVIDRRLHDEPTPRHTGDERKEHTSHLYYPLPQKQIVFDQRFDLQRSPQRVSATRESLHHPNGSHIYNHHRSQHAPGADAHHPEHIRGPTVYRSSVSYHSNGDDDRQQQHGNRSKDPSAGSTHATRHPWMHPGTVATQHCPSSQHTSSNVPSGIPQDSRAVPLSRSYIDEPTSRVNSPTSSEATGE